MGRETLVVCESPVQVWQLGQAAERMSLPITVIASSQPGAAPADWSDARFWKPWTRVVLTADVSAAVRRMVIDGRGGPLDHAPGAACSTDATVPLPERQDDWLREVLSDAVAFARGDGHDTILDRGHLGIWGDADGGSDRIEFGSGIAPGDIDVVETSPEDIALRIRDTGETITILGAIGDGVRRIEQIVFADGTTRSASELLAKALVGGPGNDTLYGSPDSDVLDGGAGDDLLEANGGNDTYRFGRGDGADTILDRGAQYWWGFADGGYDIVELKPGVGPDDLDVIDTGPDDIVLKIRGTTDQLTLLGQVSDTARRVEEVRFADGTVWTIADIRARSLAPTSGDDVHYAGATAATLEGGAGNDTLYGSPEGDVLDGGSGDDLLAGNVATISIGSGGVTAPT